MPLLAKLYKRALKYQKQFGEVVPRIALANKGKKWVTGDRQNLVASAAYPTGLGAAWHAVMELAEYGVPKSAHVLNRVMDRIYIDVVLPVIIAEAKLSKRKTENFKSFLTQAFHKSTALIQGRGRRCGAGGGARCRV